MNHLNDRQKEACKHIDGPLLVLAGAGSGKTSVITQKIAYLIEQCGYKAHNIVAVTFTNKAAREMKERVKSLLTGSNSRGLTVSTFHNLGLTILRRETKHTRLRDGFTLFDQNDAVALIKDILTRTFPDEIDQAGFIQNLISNWKNDFKQPIDLFGKLDDQYEVLACSIYEEYEQMLAAYNAVDFDDLISMPTLLFQQNPEVLAKWQRKVRYLLVDEYQDTNTAQYLLVKMLVELHSRFTVVGDDDQSIYSWRGARPENLGQLQTDFPTLKVVKLEQNYRSTSRILKAANTVIDNNPHVFDKKLWSEMGAGDEIRVIRCNNEDHEAEKVAQEIVHRKMMGRLDYKDFAILYRGNHQARLLEIKLQANQVPYKMNGGQSFFGRAEIKDIMSYLRLVINPDDDTAFLRIINTPRREIGAATLEKLNLFAADNMVSLYAACQDHAIKEVMQANAAERLLNFGEWMERIRRKLHESDNPAEIVKELVYDIDYPGWLRTDSNSANQAEKRLDNVWQLIDNLDYLIQNGDEDDDSEVQVETAVGKLVLRDILERQEEDDEDYDAVQMLTLHASKGLEYPHVYIVGLEEEILPHRNSIESGDIEEERRLMYVGITRAKRTLALTYAAKRKQFGEIIECTPSRFLDEMPEEDLQWEGKATSEQQAQSNRNMGKATLASLMSMLD